MNRSIGVALAASAVLAFGAVSASAQSTSFGTQIHIIGTHENSLHDTVVYGYLDSSRAKCRSGRTVKIFANSPSTGSTLVDTARTSDEGGWAGRADFSGSGGITATATRKVFGRKHHRKVCKPASDTYLFV